MKIYKTLFFALFLTLSNFVFSQNLPEDKVSQFFKTYETSPDMAIEALMSNNPWLNGNEASVNQVKIQLKSSIELVGTYYGFEKVSEIEKGESFVQLTYFGKHDRQPLRFIFTFYKPDKEWRVQNFFFDDKLLED